ncbi:MAG: multicopper oxidase domain-containing protein, partial [Acidobacteriota bacterium]|nr:multicopper oxidase domain-containing protein [Acidobacteriota bacterium]
LDINRSADNQDAAMTLHAVSQNWGEGIADCDVVQGGGGKGIDANPGDATWLEAQFQALPWGSPGGDFAAASATASVGPGNTDFGIWDSNAAGNEALRVNVQSWLDTSTTNHGWILVGDEGRLATARRFSSREGAAEPLLVVEFTPVGDVFACCFVDGDCSVLESDVCSGQGGTPFVDVATCEPNPCPQPVGACCNADESCSDAFGRSECEAAGGLFQDEGSLCSDTEVDCGLEPFVDMLPLPGALEPVGTRTDGTPQYEVIFSAERQQLHRDLPPTDVWTYNGSYPGPTIEATSGQPIEVTYINDLPAKGRRGGHLFEVDECPHGPNYWQDTARAVTHLHGGHVPARFDGQPEYHILPGESDVYEYPNAQDAATLWYHDHALGITRLNVYAGMAAYYLLRDDVETALGLPSGEFEIPAVIQDREFNPDGSFFYPPTIVNAFYGDKVLVNGKVWPYLAVKQGKYRFRFINGSQARNYTLRLENLADPGQIIPFWLIGTDLGLISAPIALDTFHAAPAERFDVVVDFAGLPAGTELVLRNDDQELPRVANVMKLVVGNEPGHTAALPATLRPVTPIPVDEATVTRRFLLERVAEPCSGQEWLIRSLDAAGNVIGEHWDDISEFPILGETEIWEFENISNMMHPMHVHLVKFQVVNREDSATGALLPLEPWEDTTWKDTVRVPPDTITRIIARFEDYPGKFSYHCHLLDHEDHEMMRQFQATNDPAGCVVNGVCEPGEDCISCAADCGFVSGAQCGNGLCEIGDGEDCLSCPADCAGRQKGSPARLYCCGDGDGTNPILDCGFAADGFTVVDDRCRSGGFFCRVAPRVAACCGDALCEGQEATASCGVDCDCSRFRDRRSCASDSACTWDTRTKTCIGP